MFGSIFKSGMSLAPVLVLVGFGMAYFTFTIFDLASNRTIGYMIQTAPIWAPIITFLLFFEMWLAFVRKEFNLKQGRVTLEIKLPEEIYKSPEAMELVLIQLYQTASPDNHVQTYWDGKNPPTYSLEMVARGGDVRFYMNVPRKKFKGLTETHLYAQYPGIEITELNIDYTSEIPWDPTEYGYFSLHFTLKKEDALPIKTYFEYGLHTMPKEEEKIDPITSMLDMLGSTGPGEFYWIQILITANRETNFKTGTLRTIPDWKGDCDKTVQNIIDGAVKRAGAESTSNVMQLLTDTERDTIKAIERSKGKFGFNTAIRGMYIAKKDAFTPGERIGPLISGWRAFDDLNRNAIGIKWRTDFNWNWWQDPKGKRALAHKRREFYEYKKRVYNNQIKGDRTKVMTTEELATIFHLPGKVALTPTLGRIPSQRSEAPSNLPTG